MDSFDVSSYDEESIASLVATIKAIREQYLANGSNSQFWFDVSQTSNITLTEQVAKKWLHVLSNSGLLYYYKPINGFVFEQNLALIQHRLGDNHDWKGHMLTPFASDFSSDSFACFALDIYDTDLNLLLKLVKMTNLGPHFYVNKFDQFYYDDTPLVEINKSPVCKALLRHLLASDDHTLSTEEVQEILADYSPNNNDVNQQKNEVTSKISKEIFKVSQHKVSLDSHRCGNKVDYYKLTLK